MFVRLFRTTRNVPVHVNLHNVILMYPSGSGGTMIEFIGGGMTEVRETLDEIGQLMDTARKV
jgi:hypothetical protein